MESIPEHICGFIERFIAQDKRERLFALARTPRGIRKLENLTGSLPIDKTTCHRIDVQNQNEEYVRQQLLRHKAPAECVVWSGNSITIGHTPGVFLLDDAIRECFGRTEGVVISCIPGRLAYYESEVTNGRYLCNA